MLHRVERFFLQQSPANLSNTIRAVAIEAYLQHGFQWLVIGSYLELSMTTRFCTSLTP
jgi:hypothetical protein